MEECFCLLCAVSHMGLKTTAVNKDKSRFLNELSTSLNPPEVCVSVTKCPDNFICWHLTSSELIFSLYYLRERNLSPVLLPSPHTIEPQTCDNFVISNVCSRTAEWQQGGGPYLHTERRLYPRVPSLSCQSLWLLGSRRFSLQRKAD